MVLGAGIDSIEGERDNGARFESMLTRINLIHLSLRLTINDVQDDLSLLSLSLDSSPDESDFHHQRMLSLDVEESLCLAHL